MSSTDGWLYRNMARAAGMLTAAFPDHICTVRVEKIGDAELVVMTVQWRDAGQIIQSQHAKALTAFEALPLDGVEYITDRFIQECRTREQS